MSEQKKTVNAGTVARTIILALALINQVLTVSGHPVLPIEDEQVNTLVSTGWTVAASLLAWWRNNSFTGSAIEADNVLKELKKG